MSSKRLAAVDIFVDDDETSTVWAGAGCTVSSKRMAAVDAASCWSCCCVVKKEDDRDCVEGGWAVSNRCMA